MAGGERADRAQRTSDLRPLTSDLSGYTVVPYRIRPPECYHGLNHADLLIVNLKTRLAASLIVAACGLLPRTLNSPVPFGIA
jgi:hypothetical protein